MQSKPVLRLRLSWFLMGILAWFLIFGFVSECNAFHLEFLDDWDKTDKLLLAGYTLVWFIDWGQTRDIAMRPDEYYEDQMEALIGRHPSVQTVDVCLIGSYILNVFIANTLEGWWRKAFLGFFIYHHGEAAHGNYGIGLRINFS